MNNNFKKIMKLTLLATTLVISANQSLAQDINIDKTNIINQIKNPDTKFSDRSSDFKSITYFYDDNYVSSININEKITVDSKGEVKINDETYIKGDSLQNLTQNKMENILKSVIVKFPDKFMDLNNQDLKIANREQIDYNS